jgi:hypothetical protein
MSKLDIGVEFFAENPDATIADCERATRISQATAKRAKELVIHVTNSGAMLSQQDHDLRDARKANDVVQGDFITTEHDLISRNERIYTLRVDHGLTSAQIAREVGMSVDSVRKIMRRLTRFLDEDGASAGGWKAQEAKRLAHCWSRASS